MTKNLTLLRYQAGNLYTADDGTTHAFNSRFVLPNGMPAAAVTAAVTASGAVTRIAGGGNRTVCPGLSFQPRKLRFFFPNGGSFSVPIADRTNLIAARDNIIAALTLKPVCVTLIGEHRKGVEEAYRLPGFTLAPSAASSAPTDGLGKQYQYSGTMAYKSDGILGNTYYQSFKIATEDPALGAPTLYSAALTTVGNNAVLPVGSALKPCVGSDWRKPRYFEVTSLIGAALGTASAQHAKIPVTSDAFGDILAVGQELGNTMTSTQCLSYSGEDNRRFDLA